MSYSGITSTRSSNDLLLMIYARHAGNPHARAVDVNGGLSYYYQAVKLLVLLQPSSAGAERVFSVLKRYFDEQQELSLTDAIRVAIFLEVNKRPLV